MRTIVALAIAALAIAGGAGAATGPPQQQPEVRSLDGSGNNVRNPTWGQTFTQYLRVTDPNYADGVGQPVSGPSARNISNRIFNDEGQNLFSENDVTQWGWTWGQFLDHTFGLRDETPAENLPIPFDTHDPLESFQNDVGLDRLRPDARRSRHGDEQAQSAAADQHRQQLHRRVQRLRRNRRAARMAAHRSRGREPGEQRRDAAAAGRLPAAGRRARQRRDGAADGPDGRAHRERRAGRRGRRRAGEREHRAHRRSTRCSRGSTTGSSGCCRTSLSNEQKFQIARRVVGAEEQYITYNEFLPALGVQSGAVPRLRPEREREPLERVRDRRLPGSTAWCTASSTSTPPPGRTRRRCSPTFADEGDRGRRRRRTEHPAHRSR